MHNMIAELAKSELTDVDVENLKKQLLRYQQPVAFQVTALVQLIEYQKSLLPQHLVEPFIDSIKDYINKSLSNI